VSIPEMNKKDEFSARCQINMRYGAIGKQFFYIERTMQLKIAAFKRTIRKYVSGSY
jgi:hypothetical protein